jgi:hypothetical protein
MRRVLISIACFLVSLSLAACARYYEITDLYTGDVYYATGSGVQRTFTGQVVFWDALTGYQVSLPSWKLKGISKEAFEEVKSDQIGHSEQE